MADFTKQNLSLDIITSIEQKLNYWSNQLRDMSGRNRLLFWRDTKASSAVITQPDLFPLFEQIVVKNRPIFAPLPVDESQLNMFDGTPGEENGAATREYESVGTNKIVSDKTVKGLNNALSNLRYKSRIPTGQSRFHR